MTTGVGPDNHHESFPTEDILLFYDSVNCGQGAKGSTYPQSLKEVRESLMITCHKTTATFELRGNVFKLKEVDVG